MGIEGDRAHIAAMFQAPLIRWAIRNMAPHRTGDVASCYRGDIASGPSGRCARKGAVWEYLGQGDQLRPAGHLGGTPDAATGSRCARPRQLPWAIQGGCGNVSGHMGIGRVVTGGARNAGISQDERRQLWGWVVVGWGGGGIEHVRKIGTHWTFAEPNCAQNRYSTQRVLRHISRKYPKANKWKHQNIQCPYCGKVYGGQRTQQTHTHL